MFTSQFLVCYNVLEQSTINYGDNLIESSLIAAFPHKRKESDINLLVLLFLRRKFNGIRKFDTTGSLL